ncbi:hypothetical protein A4A49_24611 [Nicotiana attenuata]|uniref:Uncharacterized protein n=1 Tax=Nicotiana attenuata TaxID=49451 RepID=A0A1J6I9B7_NICAT|nr:hypothetical protein A4A49_24611 [Nicotiana attenuata]
MVQNVASCQEEVLCAKFYQFISCQYITVILRSVSEIIKAIVDVPFLIKYMLKFGYRCIYSYIEWNKLILLWNIVML